jgi:SAM-dependent methyltransferase
MNAQTMTSHMSEIDTLKARLKATWESGDYGHFARYLEPGALEFLGRLPIEEGTQMLDVACGAGQISIPAARAGAHVTGIDVASNLIGQAKARARKEGVDVRFEEGDAEALPYQDGAFDMVISLIGAMFAPRPEKVAAELLRVCRPGGVIVMANWTPEGFIGQMFKTIGKHVPPHPLMVSPVKWGDESIVHERLAKGASEIRINRWMYPFDYPFPPAEVVEFFRTYYGPANRAFAALDARGQAALREDLEALWIQHSQADGHATYCEGEYLEVVAVRQS